MTRTDPSPRQIAAALALLGRTAGEMAMECRLAESDVSAALAGHADGARLGAVVGALEAAGIEFLFDDGPGVRQRLAVDALAPEDLNASNDG